MTLLGLAVLLALGLIASGGGAQESDGDEEGVAGQAAPGAQAAAAAAQARAAQPKKFRDFADVAGDAKKYEGLFDLYEKDEHLYATIKGHQFDKPFLAPMAIARGMASAGTPLNFGDEWVIMFHRAGDRVHLVRKNIHYEAPKGTPLEKAVQQNYLDSVIMAIPIVSENPPGGGVLVDFSDIFFTNFADLPLGALDRSRTTWHQVKAFQKNVELQVKATYARGGSASSSGYDDGVVDPRAITVVVHYSLTQPPEPGYKPRMADQRVGYFISATKDFGSKNLDTEFTRRLNRWRLEKANASAELSPPKKQVVWWVEDTVPHEYRPYVEEGILEWNKAFEKVGFRNALDVRWQQEGDEFDPEDINYCTFRWVTTPFTFAMSGLRSDPITGEMIDGDVIFDASWIRAWKEEYAFLVGTPIAAAGGASAVEAAAEALAMPLDVGEVISPIMAARYGYGLPIPSRANRLAMQLRHERDDGHGHSHDALPHVVPSNWSPLQIVLNQRLAAGRSSTCQYGGTKRHEFRLAALAFAARAQENEKGEGDNKDDKEQKDEKEKKAELPEEFIGQVIKEVVMHEVGHSLGLRHNFKASSMLSLDEVNDTSITREKGQTGSVMDYNPVNISLDPEKQGDFASTTIGPYDYWAIEYAYKPIQGNEEEELKKIAARSPESELRYATDEDLSISNDPLVNAYDLGNDPLAYAKQRIGLAEKLLPDLDEKVIRDGDSWARLRSAFLVLLGEYGNGAYLASSMVAGQNFAKHHKGGEDTEDPIVPVAGKKQREALAFLTETILSDKAFQFSPRLLRRLTMESWYHWGSDMYLSGTVDYPVYDRILSIQRLCLSHCLDASVLRRLQNQKLLAEDDEPLELAEVFRTLSESIWSELALDAASTPESFEISVIRRNLQREHLRRLSSIVIGQGGNSLDDLYSYISFAGSSYEYPADAKSLARMHLKELKGRTESVLGREGLKIEDATRAHLEEAREQIDLVLDAQLTAGRP